MLAGSYPMSVDAKARVTLPAVFRKQLVDGDKKTIYLVPLNGCVNGFTPEGFEAYVDGLFEYGDNHFDPRSRDDVRLRTGLWARAVEVDIDSAGRVALGKHGGFYGNDAAFVYLSQKPVPVPHRLYNKIRLIYIAVSFLRHVFRAAQRVQMMRFRDVELIAVIRCPSAGAYRYLSTCGKFG